MASRNRPARQLPGNALGGVLRNAARQARSTTRRSVAIPGPEGATGTPGPAGPAGPTGATGPAGPAGPAGLGVLARAKLTTDATGKVVWTYGPLPFTPHVIATPVATTPMFVTISSVTGTSVTLNAFTPSGAVSANRSIHVVAFGP